MFLEKINSPSDLKTLKIEELKILAEEIRQFMLKTLSQTPGHFASNFGVVELTIALHYIFESPNDKIIWDVGHQAYAHKIITGRRDVFHTIRKLNGISGYPSIFESEHDAFSVGHSSTSISAAVGMAIANKLQNKQGHVIAIIGDGALTAGLAYEGLNNAGFYKPNILIILNDNDIAIDPNISALKKYFTRLVASKRYNKFKNFIYQKLTSFKIFNKKLLKIIRVINENIKTSITDKSNFFETMGIRYFGPVDGHDLPTLIELLGDLKVIEGPKLLHIKTIKGKGYHFAEKEQTKWHSTSESFDIETGEPINHNPQNTPPRFQDVFGHTIVELARKNPLIVGITPAMPTGCSLNIMMKEMPERAFDVGIAEQHAVTFSAGLALQGLIPFCNIYSTFMQRAYDQVIHDVALQNLHVVFCLDRGGLVGSDGATHHGAYDLSYMRCIPNMVIAAPRNEIELRNLMYTAQLTKNSFPFSIRYPRGNGFLIDWKKEFSEIPIGKGEKICDGEDIAILTIGTIAYEALIAKEKLAENGIFPAIFDLRFVKPLDNELLHQIMRKFKYILTVEDNSIIGGFGSAIAEFMANNNYSNTLKILGIPDRFIEHGTQKELYKLCGYDADSIIANVLKFANVKIKQ